MDSRKVTKLEIDRWRKDYNIHIIEYDSKDNHKEVNDILNEIISEKGSLTFDWLLNWNFINYTLKSLHLIINPKILIS